ncbi:hypothetical protein [Ktedonobacter racemifer]|uniref:Uncharacterized protein n=1 Tax=Ktedonobacter racemifer DSM 44963 TaxID=485913 RepID=D6TZE7_KTERA|nr:hypothetical protein [Ktedonobacter racemifer]EFH81937.1 hypothetical protein Krac_2697 [Ktedonobacter racemifer DSM 44963]
MNTSEVALLRQQIELEMLAMKRALSEVALGMARHGFINARMERVGSFQDALALHVGADEANLVVCELYVQAMEQEEPTPVIL